jgi:hypothetical protein
MKDLKIALLGLAAAALVPAFACAQDKPVSFAFNGGVASDYVFRGISQTDEKAQVFGGADATFAGGKGYAGVWASNVDFNNGTNAEVDVYGGFKPTAGPVTFDLGVIYYGYVGSPSGSHQPYVEFKGAASAPAGPVTLGAAVYYSIPDSKFSVSGALGHQQVVGSLDYSTWNIGVTGALTDHLSADLRYWDTDEHGFGKIYGSRVVIGLKATF